MTGVCYWPAEGRGERWGKTCRGRRERDYSINNGGHIRFRDVKEEGLGF